MDPFEGKLRAVLADLVYKDWSFRIEKDGIGLWFMQVQVKGPDATTGDAIEWSGRKWRMSMHMTTSEIVQTALKAVLTAEEHETRERFQYKGRAIFGPHLNVEMLWHLANETEVRR